MKNTTGTPSQIRIQRISVWLCALLLVSLACGLSQNTPTTQVSGKTPGVTTPPQSTTQAPPGNATTEAPGNGSPTPTFTPTATQNIPSDGRVDPGNVRPTWTAQTCQATILSRKDQVTMDIAGIVSGFNLGIDQEVLLVQNADIHLTEKARADIDYGVGNKITIYGPSAGAGTMKIVEWNGARQVAIDAGAGRVVEDDSTGCTTEVVALGNVRLIPTGTDFAFVVDPNTPDGGNQVQLAVFDGSVKAVDANGNDMATWQSGRAGIITNGAVDGIFDNPGSQSDILQRLENGGDIFGTPLETKPITPQITYNLWTSWDGKQLDRLNEVIRQYQAQNPNASFLVNTATADELQNRFRDAIDSGEQLPLLIGPNTWGPQLYRAGLVADLTNQIDPAAWKSLLIAARQGAVYQGVLTGLPITSQGVVLYRNKLIMTDRPKTLDELFAMAKQASANDYTGFSFDIAPMFSGGHLEGLGGHLMDDKNNPAFDNDTGIAWLTMLRGFQDYGEVVFNSDDDLNAFKSGNVGFIIDSTVNYAQIADALGEGNIAIDPWPNTQNGSLAGYLTTENIYLSAREQGDRAKAGVLFMQYLLAPEAQAVLAGEGRLPSIRTLDTRGSFIRQGVNALRGAVALPVVPEMNAYWDPLSQMIQQVVFNRADIEGAIKEAYKAIYATIDQYR